jgi:hypothetical protein
VNNAGTRLQEPCGLPRVEGLQPRIVKDAPTAHPARTHGLPRATRPGGPRAYAVSIAAAFSSPSSWIDCSRILYFWTLPETVIGKPSTNL